jgi:hypothetical protein
MINKLKDGSKIAFRLIFVALLSTNHKCTHPCFNAAKKKKKVYEVQKMVLGIRNTQSIACEVWSLCFPEFCCKSLIIPFSLRDIISVTH